MAAAVLLFFFFPRKCLLPVFSPCCHGDSQYRSSIDDGFLLVVRHKLNSRVNILRVDLPSSDQLFWSWKLRVTLLKVLIFYRKLNLCTFPFDFKWTTTGKQQPHRPTWRWNGSSFANFIYTVWAYHYLVKQRVKTQGPSCNITPQEHVTPNLFGLKLKHHSVLQWTEAFHQQHIYQKDLVYFVTLTTYYCLDFAYWFSVSFLINTIKLGSLFHV